MSNSAYTDLDSWHAEWMFACPEGKRRFIVVLKNDAGMVIGRKKFEATNKAVDAHLMYTSIGPDTSTVDVTEA